MAGARWLLGSEPAGGTGSRLSPGQVLDIAELMAGVDRAVFEAAAVRWMTDHGTCHHDSSERRIRIAEGSPPEDIVPRRPCGGASRRWSSSSATAPRPKAGWS